jgi:hypothetical protein
VLVRGLLDEPEDDGAEQDEGSKFHGASLAELRVPASAGSEQIFRARAPAILE